MSDLIHLVYTSKAVCPMNSDDFLRLLIPAREKNHRLHITGMLLYQKQNFLQVLEGREMAVEKLFKSIIQDGRHENVTLLIKRPVTNREYAEWDLKFINLDTLNLSKIRGHNAYTKVAIDSRSLEMGNFTHTFLSIFRDLKL